MLLLSLALTTLSYAGTHAVDVTAESIPLGPWSQVFKDADGNLSAAQLLAHPERYAHFPGTEFTSFTFTDAAYWFVIPLHNPQSTPLTRLLVFEPIWLDDIRLTLVSADGHRQELRGGDALPFAERALSHRKINFSLTLPPGQTQLLVRVHTVDPFIVNMRLWERSAFYQADSLETAYLGLVYGILGAMLLYNLVLFVAVRESVYAAYVGYVFTFILWHLTNNGLLFQWLWPASPLWADWSQSIFLYLIMLSGLYFAINFLQLRHRMPRTYKWAIGLLFTIILSDLVTPLGGYQLHVTSGVLWVIAYTPAVLILGLLSLMAGNRAARYFLPATAAGFLGSGITALAVSGFIPFSLYTYHAVDVGMLIDAILLSIALADRLKIARTETEQARSALIEAAQQHTEDLEAEVAQRTRELREANATKDKFFSIIAHDLRGPLGSLALFYNDIVKSSSDFNAEILQLTRDTTNQIRNLLEQLLIWARSQRGDIEFTPRALDLGLALNTTEKLLMAQANAKAISLSSDHHHPCWVYADEAMLLTVLRNLLGNAIKYTPHEGTIHIAVSCQDSVATLRISDSGVGMDTKTLQTLFRLDQKPRSRPGTSNEVGSGLGLILCHEFIQRNGGSIGAESSPGQGSTFWFTLPAVAQPGSEQHSHSAASHTRLSILLADDRAVSRETGARLLRELEHQVSLAEDGLEALQQATSREFDLILMDIDMPRMNGIEAARRIREAGFSGTIVAWSSYLRAEIEQLEGANYFDGFLDKPLTRDALSLELQRLYRTSR